MVVFSDSKCLAAKAILHDIDIRVINPDTNGWQQSLRMSFQQLECIHAGSVKVNIQGKEANRM